MDPRQPAPVTLKKHLTIALVFLTAGLARAAPDFSPTTGKNRPNILLVMADDQGWGDTGYNG